MKVYYYRAAIIRCTYIFAWFWLVVSCNTSLTDEVSIAYDNLPETIDFNFHVKPIISDKCFACHGPDESALKAGLRLDLVELATNPLESGNVAVVSGEPFNSQLVERIISDDPELMMPPPDSHLELEAHEKATLIKWIEQGAEYKPHWSFIKPEQPDLPAVNDDGLPKNQIDNFVFSKLETHDLQPSPEADKQALIRRLYFNLTGLPPSVEEIDAFLSDDSPESYEKVVDRLLSSKNYGERMATEWMDVARYTDSDGYLDDKHRDFSPWRDWVIKAFNENMPYDQFVTWQLAGDLLPDATQESIVATAFNRLHRKNSEAGIVFEEFRTEYVTDRTNTLGKAFLGLSLECAKCHDHKYDPVSQEDYFKMFAFFNSTDELGTAIYGPDQTPGPALLLTTQEQEEIIEYLDKDIEEQENRLLQKASGPDKEYEGWAQNKQNVLTTLNSNKTKGQVVHYSFDKLLPGDKETAYSTPDREGAQAAIVFEPEIQEGIKGKAVFLNDFTKINLPEKIGWFGRTDPFSISLAIFPDTLYPEAGIFYHCEDFRLGLKGYSLYLEDNRVRFVISHSWPQNAIQVSTREPLGIKEWTQVTLTYDGSSKASGVHIFLNGDEVPVNVDYDNLYKGILYEPNIHTYGFAGFTLGMRDKMKTLKKGGLDELKIYNRALTPLEVQYDYDSDNTTRWVLDHSEGSYKLRDLYNQLVDAEVSKDLKQLKSTRDRLNQEMNGIREIMVMGDLPEPRRTYILERGVYDAHGEEVKPGTPEKVLPFSEEYPANRLGLTKWLFDPSNPLTSRVYVNRIWQMHFGRGIVKTSDDFGNQGAIPTHPELLDWLAVSFIESGWDIKKLHKLIVMSSTFRQSSKNQPKLLEMDPENKLLARGPSFRMSAEMIRDNALAISGLLVNTVGGTSVYPYQPEGLWDEISNKVWRYKYLQEPGEGLYRRSLYTIWKRSSPPPSMLIFDVPGRDVCTVQRPNTSTPLQALVLLNDPQYLEAARVLAEKMMTDGTTEVEDQLQQAFRRATGRIPQPEEVGLLLEFYQQELDRFSTDPVSARQYLANGEASPSGKLVPVQLAAMATVVHSIMNTNESYTLR